MRVAALVSVAVLMLVLMPVLMLVSLCLTADRCRCASHRYGSVDSGAVW